MKAWFLSLKNKTQNIILCIGWGISVLLCILIAISPSDTDNLSVLDYSLVLFLIGAVTISIFFSIWKSKSKRVVSNAPQTFISASLDKNWGFDADETVKVFFEDGSFEEYKTYHTKISDPEWCLVVDGGKTYHLRFNCFHKWSEEYKNNFVAWKAIKLKDALAQGYTLCRFCAKADEPLSFDDIDNEEKGNDDDNEISREDEI